MTTHRYLWDTKTLEMVLWALESVTRIVPPLLSAGFRADAEGFSQPKWEPPALGRRERTERVVRRRARFAVRLAMPATAHEG